MYSHGAGVGKIDREREKEIGVVVWNSGVLGFTLAPGVVSRITGEIFAVMYFLPSLLIHSIFFPIHLMSWAYQLSTERSISPAIWQTYCQCYAFAVVLSQTFAIDRTASYHIMLADIRDWTVNHQLDKRWRYHYTIATRLFLLRTIFHKVFSL